MEIPRENYIQKKNKRGPKNEPQTMEKEDLSQSNATRLLEEIQTSRTPAT